MENLGLTLVVAFLAGFLVLIASPFYGLIVYIGALFLYPGLLSVEIGTFNFPIGRIVILLLYISILFRKNQLSKFQFLWTDMLMIILFACQLLAGATVTQNYAQFLENRAGRFCDITLPYFAVRLIITNRTKYIMLLKSILSIAIILVFFACYESFTGKNLLSFGASYLTRQHNYRLGLARAFASFGNANYLGIFFAMAGGMCTGLLNNVRRKKRLWGIGIILMALGVFFTLTSGAWFSAIGVIFFIAFYRYRRYWKQAVLTLMVTCIAVELISNRHFFEIIDRFALNSQTAWYRSKLIKVALFEGGMSGHWLAGYGLKDPNWSVMIDGRNHTDMCNHYLLILCRYGLIGFIPFCMLIVAALKKLFEDFWLLTRKCNTWLVWCLASGVFGALFAFNSVSLFGASNSFFYILLGLCGSLSLIMRKTIIEEKRIYKLRSQQNMLIEPLRTLQ